MELALGDTLSVSGRITCIILVIYRTLRRLPMWLGDTNMMP